MVWATVKVKGVRIDQADFHRLTKEIQSQHDPISHLCREVARKNNMGGQHIQLLFKNKVVDQIHECGDLKTVIEQNGGSFASSLYWVVDLTVRETGHEQVEFTMAEPDSGLTEQLREAKKQREAAGGKFKWADDEE